MIQEIILGINWNIKNPISEVIGDQLIVTGKDEKTNSDVTITIEKYKSVIEWLEREANLYKNLFDNVKGPKSHFKNSMEVYLRRLQILRKYSEKVNLS